MSDKTLPEGTITTNTADDPPRDWRYPGVSVYAAPQPRIPYDRPRDISDLIGIGAGTPTPRIPHQLTEDDMRRLIRQELELLGLPALVREAVREELHRFGQMMTPSSARPLDEVLGRLGHGELISDPPMCDPTGAD